MSSPVIVKAYLSEGKLSVQGAWALHIIRPKSCLTQVITILLLVTYASSKSIFFANQSYLGPFINEVRICICFWGTSNQ